MEKENEGRDVREGTVKREKDILKNQ